MCDLLQAEPDKVVLVMRGVVHVLQQLQPHVPHQLLNFDCVLFLYSLEHFLTGVFLEADQTLHHDLHEVGQLILQAGRLDD